MYISKILCDDTKECESCGKNVLFYRRRCPYCNAENASEDERNRIFDHLTGLRFRLLFTIPILSILLVVSIIATNCFGFERDVRHSLSEISEVTDTTAEGEYCYVDIAFAQPWFYTYPDFPGNYDLSNIEETLAGSMLSEEGKVLMRNVETLYYLVMSPDEKVYVLSVDGGSVENFQLRMDGEKDAFRVYGTRVLKLDDISMSLKPGVDAEQQLEEHHEFMDEVNKQIIVKADLDLQERGYYTEKKPSIGSWLIWVDVCLLIVVVILSKIRKKANGVVANIKAEGI